jgi:flagellar basal-body rod protein FlgB
MKTSESSQSMLETFLRLTSTREKAISANMANIDTPGYRALDINFESEMSRAMNQVPMKLADGSEVQLHPVVRQVHGLMERPDGNDVNLDREGLLMAETQLQYSLGIQLLKRHFHQMLSAINGGSSS